jgi:hypothetical protein
MDVPLPDQRNAGRAAVLAMPLAAQAAAKQERVVVTFKDGGAAAAKAAIARVGGRVVLDLSDLNAVAVRLPGSAIAALKRDGRVASVEADPLRYLMGNKGSARSTSRIAAISGEAVPHGITMVQAQQLTFNPEGKQKVCVIDAGYDMRTLTCRRATLLAST